MQCLSVLEVFQEQAWVGEEKGFAQQGNMRCLTCYEAVLYYKEGANKQVISSQADSLIKISRIWADFFPANTSNQPI
ncbi:hypothetical protein BANRA_02858 [Klebsiella quasipneumoniae]|nr:hypothetical protein BANRA_02858 [Klebsiella quasipneumoniae]